MATKSSSINIKPLAGYLLVEPLKAEKVTAGGIYLPDSNDEKPQEGTVLKVGAALVTDSGTKKEAQVKEGEKIIYKKWGGTEVKVNGVEYLFVKFEDVLAVVTA